MTRDETLTAEEVEGKDKLKKKLKNEAGLYCQEYATIDNYDSVHRAYIFSAEPREKRIAELEAQIEKMKCCYNCKHSRTEYEHCKTDKHEKWEMIEK